MSGFFFTLSLMVIKDIFLTGNKFCTSNIIQHQEKLIQNCYYISVSEWYITVIGKNLVKTQKALLEFK